MRVLTILKAQSSKTFMVGYLAAALAVAVWGTAQQQSLLTAAVIVGLYVFADLVWTWLRDRTVYLPLSAMVSGLIGTLVLDPQSSWWVVATFPLLAVAGKQLLRWQKRHLFNPAAFSLVVLSLVHPAAIAWWGVAWWGTGGKLAAILCGLFILFRISRYRIAFPFLVVYALGLALIFAVRGQGFGTVGPLLSDGTLIFFATVMLVEPVTTSYRTKRIQMAYGAGVGLLAVLAPLSGIPLPDGFLPPLLVGNLAAAFVSRRKRRVIAAPAAAVPVAVP